MAKLGTKCGEFELPTHLYPFPGCAPVKEKDVNRLGVSTLGCDETGLRGVGSSLDGNFHPLTKGEFPA